MNTLAARQRELEKALQELQILATTVQHLSKEVAELAYLQRWAGIREGRLCSKKSLHKV